MKKICYYICLLILCIAGLAGCAKGENDKNINTDAQEYGQFGITCNVICPGAMTDASRSWAATDPESYAASVAHQPIKRLGDPDTDIAPAVLFFASEESRFVTGQTIALDRGSTRF